MKRFSLILFCVLFAVIAFGGIDGSQTYKIIADGDANRVQTLDKASRDKLNTALTVSDEAIDTVQTISAEQRNKLKAIFPSGGGLPTGPFITGLVSYWKLDETSGTRSDSYGSNHLTDNNTVTSGTGKSGNCAHFTAANVEHLSIADNASLSVGGSDFSISMWFKPTTNVNAPIVSKYPPSGAQREFTFRIITSVYNLIIGQDSSTTDSVNGNTGPSDGVWNHLVITWNNATTTGTIYIDDDGGNGKVFAITGSYDDIAAFTLGGWSSPGAGNTQDGDLDEVAFWKGRVITDAEVGQLYAASNGVFYPTFAFNNLHRWMDFMSWGNRYKKHHRDPNFMPL